MNRREFINLLSDSLAGRVPAKLISEKADYYRKYISEHAAAKGCSEEDIIREIGAPELIANSIIDAYEAAHGVYQGDSDSHYSDVVDDEGNSSPEDGRGFSLQMGDKGCALLFFVIIFLVLAAGMWLVRLIAAYPLLIVAAVLLYYFWYKKK